MTISNTADIITTLQTEITKNLSPHFPKSGKFALLDFPSNKNAGDSAIWLGALAYFRNIHNATPAYVCDINSYSKSELKLALPEGPIFLNGGGNFGDIWSGHHDFRETILKDFPDRLVIQMPQSIYFSNPDSLKKSSEIINSHPDFILLVRDRKSLEIAQENFSCKILLCPDMAFCLGALQKPILSEHSLLLVLRQDREKIIQDNISKFLEYPCYDWIDEDPEFYKKIRTQTIKELIPTLGLNALNKFKRRKLLYLRLAENRLKKGINLLSSAEFIITDRLHIHIISLLLEIPHIFLDNSYGKISNFAKAWTKESTISYSEKSLEKALKHYQETKQKEKKIA